MIEDCPDELKGRVLDSIEERFGIPPDVVAEHRLYVGGQDRVFLGVRHEDGGTLGALVEDCDPDTGGLPLARPMGTVKPTTDALQVLGRHATRNVVRLGPDAARRYVAGEDVPADRLDAGGAREGAADEAGEEATRGWVVVRYVDPATGEAFELGCGFLRDGRLENVLPKGRRIELSHL